MLGEVLDLIVTMDLSMDQQLVSAWLQLPHVDWPPDHYSLLGLKQGEADIARIEQQVYERMEKVRRYQLTHPELATEVMNRLAQALVCLTDAAAKQAYDAAFFPGNRRGNEAGGRTKTEDPLGQLLGRRGVNGTSSGQAGQESQTEKDWRTAPPTANQDWQTAPPVAYPSWETSAPPVRLQDAAVGGPTEGPEAGPSPADAPPSTDGPEAETNSQAAISPQAQPESADQTGLSAAAVPSGRLRNRRALYARITKLRQLLWAWKQAGEFLKQEPTRVVNRPTDAMDLMAHMHAIRELLRQPPSLLGNAGEAGYHVQTLARQEDIVPRLKKLSPPQRESLARDWQAGYEFLLENRRLLRQELREHHSRGMVARAVHFLSAAVSENVGLILFVLGVLAVNLAFQESFPELRSLRARQIAFVVVVVAAKLLWWWNSFRPLPGAAPRGVDRRRTIVAKPLRRQAQSSGAKV
jgi:hypothetical protein